MNILIIDDALAKADLLNKTLGTFGVPFSVKYANNAHDGFEIVSRGGINLVLLDVVLPLSFGSKPSDDGSIWFIHEIQRKYRNGPLPLIVGTTQYADSIPRVEERFRDLLWSVIYVSNGEERWPRQLQQAMRFAQSNSVDLMLAGNNGGSITDVGIVTALKIPEFSELVDALGGGDPVRVAETNESWLKCSIVRHDRQEVRVVAACAEEMGMTAMASLVTRLSVACRPRYVILTGIMGGNAERVGLSDLVVVEESWNCQAGKISESGFVPDMKTQRCELGLANIFGNVATDDFLLDLWKSWKGERPHQLPRLFKGAVGCSAAVVADGTAFKKLEESKRKILGVEMEAFGCYDAAFRMGTIAPKVICIKSVCDLGDKNKNDVFQRYCAYLSAQVAVAAIKDPRFPLISG